MLDTHDAPFGHITGEAGQRGTRITGASTATLAELAHDTCMLAALAEALSVLQDQCDGPAECPIASRARNSLSPAIDVVIEKAWQIHGRLDILCTAIGKAKAA